MRRREIKAKNTWTIESIAAQDLHFCSNSKLHLKEKSICNFSNWNKGRGDLKEVDSFIQNELLLLLCWRRTWFAPLPDSASKVASKGPQTFLIYPQVKKASGILVCPLGYFHLTSAGTSLLKLISYDYVSWTFSIFSRKWHKIEEQITPTPWPQQLLDEKFPTYSSMTRLIFLPQIYAADTLLQLRDGCFCPCAIFPPGIVHGVFLLYPSQV